MERKDPGKEPPKDKQDETHQPSTRFKEQAGHTLKQRRLFRWALAIAIVLHLAFLAWNIPALLPDDPPPPEEEERVVFKIQDMQVQPPRPEPEPPEPEPEPPEEVPEKPAPTPEPEARKVPAPDPTPQEPEPEPTPEPIPTPEREVDLMEETTPRDLEMPAPTERHLEPMEVDIPEPPPEPEPPQGPLRVGGDVRAPVQTGGDPPEYTPAARASRVEGTVVVQAVINKQGRVEEIKVLKDLPMGLSDRAAEAIRDWRFEPATLNGEPVAVYYNLTVHFTLD